MPQTKSTSSGKTTNRPTREREENGSYHVVECTSDRSDGNGCNVFLRNWLPGRIPKNFLTRLLLCGFCANNRLVGNYRKPPEHGQQKIEATRMSSTGAGTACALSDTTMATRMRIFIDKSLR